MVLQVRFIYLVRKIRTLGIGITVACVVIYFFGLFVAANNFREGFEVVNIASYQVRPGQVIAVREKNKSMEVILNSLSGFNHSKYPWIEYTDSSMSGVYLHIPERDDIPENIKEQLIVELYSK